MVYSSSRLRWQPQTVPHSNCLLWLSSAIPKIFISGVSSRILTTFLNIAQTYLNSLIVQIPQLCLLSFLAHFLSITPSPQQFLLLISFAKKKGPHTFFGYFLYYAPILTFDDLSRPPMTSIDLKRSGMRCTSLHLMHLTAPQFSGFLEFKVAFLYY